ncbi:MAG: 16S rRNA (cytosine(1402)-N(4))-methyltransferase RsmH [Holophagales bacterium]|nr:MAG: 16S rRNA (cytosine(1402)-N(4))-methyltransferase RsmH [Holophagales bacterium]
MDGRHEPVLLDESLHYLAGERGGTVVDCTLGLGGHAAALLERAPTVRLVGIDRDPEALERAAERLAGFGDRVRLVESRFGDLREALAPLGLPPLAGVFADLGVSSLQLDLARRGFSFRRDGPLDMRMGRDGPTAADVVNSYSEADLESILRGYGEEHDARRIARAIVRARARQPIVTTGELSRVVVSAKGGDRQREGRVDPATRTFQALRLEVNQELRELERMLDDAVELLDRDGRLVVISYHSLEDRVVKHRLRDLARGEVDPTTGASLAETRALELLTRKPVRPSETEVAANPRARSARLRAARRI